MMDFLDGWLVWVGLGGGTIGLVVLAILAPSVLQIAATFVSGLISLALPLLKPAAAAIGTALGKLLSVLMTGLLRVIDDGKQIAFVATLGLVLWGAAYYLGSTKAHGRAVANDCKKVIDELRVCYRFVPRANASAQCRGQ
jgi:hypothetical protein